MMLLRRPLAGLSAAAMSRPQPHHLARPCLASRSFSADATRQDGGAAEPITISQSFTKIRYSPLRMGVTAKLLRRRTVPDAMAQALFTPKKGGPIAHGLLERMCATAKRNHGLLPEELWVDKCFVTQGPGTKRVKIMGRGRTGLKFVRSSHLNVTLKEIDFEAMIAAAGNRNQKKKWAKRRDAAKALRAETGGSGSAGTEGEEES